MCPVTNSIRCAMNVIEPPVTRTKPIGRQPIREALSRPWVIAGFVAVAFALATAFFALRWLEHDITFHPVRFAENERWLKPPQAEDIWLRTSDGENLNGWFFTSATQPAQATIIYFHGNGGNIS